MIRVSLDLSRHCIQTEIRRQYHRLLSACLKSASGDDMAEKELELLRQALETWDFSGLRARHRELAGGRDHDVALVGNGVDRISLIIDGRTIAL